MLELGVLTRSFSPAPCGQSNSSLLLLQSVLVSMERLRFTEQMKRDIQGQAESLFI